MTHSNQKSMLIQSSTTLSICIINYSHGLTSELINESSKSTLRTTQRLNINEIKINDAMTMNEVLQFPSIFFTWMKLLKDVVNKIKIYDIKEKANLMKQISLVIEIYYLSSIF